MAKRRVTRKRKVATPRKRRKVTRRKAPKRGSGY